MKRFFILWVLALTSLSLTAAPVEPKKAVEVARNFVAQHINGAENRTAKVVYIHPMPKHAESAIYAVNVGNAFVLVSGDDVAHPILGYNLDSPWPTEAALGKDAKLPLQVSGYLDDLAAQIEFAVDSALVADQEILDEWDKYSNKTSVPAKKLMTPGAAPRAATNLPDSVDPLLTTKWDQDTFYNALCPIDITGPDGHALTGCVATAMAQIIKYWGDLGYPVHGRGTHSYIHKYGTQTVNYDSAKYNYANMPSVLTSTSTAAQINAVAKLMYDCGVAANMDYGDTASGACDENARAGLINFFRFSPNISYVEKNNFSIANWHNLLKEQLAVKHPVMYSGEGTGVHTFVCDGYNQSGYFHFNFGWSGWGGNSNGWYLTDAINPGVHNYSSLQRALVGIVPDNTGNIILGQTDGTSTFMVDQPMEFYHIYGHNYYKGKEYINTCNNYVIFVPSDTSKQLVLDVISFEGQKVTVYDSIMGSRCVILSPLGTANPFVSTSHALTLKYQGDLSYSGFQLRIRQFKSNCTVGKGGKYDFPSIEDALKFFGNCVWDGDVTLKLASGTYTDNIVFNGFHAPAGRRLTITSIAGVADSVVFKPASGVVANISNSSGLVFSRIKFDATHVAAHCVQLGAGLNDIEFNHCILQGSKLVYVNHVIYKDSGSAISDIRFIGNQIFGGWYSIIMCGSSTSAKNRAILFDSNYIAGFREHGAYFYYNKLAFTHNTIEEMPGIANIFVGIDCYYLDSSLFDANRIYTHGYSMGQYGLVTQETDSATVISNNELIMYNSNGYSYGLHITYPYGTKVINNTVLQYGNAVAYGIFTNTNMNHYAEIKNNIAACVGSGTNFPLYINSATVANYDVDYNCWWSKTIVGFVRGAKTTLAAFQAAIPSAQHDIYQRPVFLDSTCLLALKVKSGMDCPKVNGVNYDINGNYRLAITTRGAYDVDAPQKNISLTVCESELTTKGISFNGKTYYKTGKYIDIIRGQNGGNDTVVTVLVNSYPSYSYTDSVELCASQLPFNYKNSGKYITVTPKIQQAMMLNQDVVDTFKFQYYTIHGCDSVVYVRALIHTTLMTILTDTACTGIYSKYGFNEVITNTTSGLKQFSKKLNSVNGCDSVVNLTVYVAPNYYFNFHDFICAGVPYKKHGFNFVKDTAGDYMFRYNGRTVLGCDSIIDIRLTAYPNYSKPSAWTHLYSWVCRGDVYSQNGFYVVTSRIPDSISVVNDTLKYKTIHGCDSVVHLQLTINDPVVKYYSDSICLGDRYMANGFSVQPTSAGVFVYKNALIGKNGCDSVVFLALTVGQTYNIIYYDNVCEGEYYQKYGFSTIVTANGTRLTHNYKSQRPNGCDSIITVFLTVHHPVHVAKTDTACETYTWNGKVYTASGDYTYTHLDSNGCTQVDTLHLTVNHPIHVAKTDTACETYTWNGKVYTTSGDYTYKHLDGNGCTQVDTLHLTIHNPVHVAKTDTACETYTWNGKVYIVSGDYTYKHLDANGCTQVDTLHLTIHNPVHVAKTDTACETYTWNGKVYTTSGDYTYKHLDSNGCTQVDTLHLTVHHPVHVAKTDTACETYTWNGKAYTTSGDYTYKHLDSNGCTQVDTLHLTVNHPVHVAKADTSCEMYTWNGKVYTASGIYTYKHLDTNGCTQVDTLHLTVHYNSVRNDTVEVCDRYTWHDSVFTESGVHQWHGFTVAGCDSTITLHLTINHSADTTITDTADNSYTWHDSVYTESGTYQWKGSTVAGCDSTVTLMLVIRHVGIEVIDGNGKKVKVYPNPTDGWLTIDADNILSIEVYDNTGRRVAEYGATNRIDLSNLPMGGYILKIRMENGSSIHHVIRN